MDILFFTVIFVSFMLLIFSIEQIGNVKTAYSPAMALGIVVIFIYLGGLLHILKWSVIFMVAVGYVCGIISLVIFVKKRKRYKVCPSHVFLVIMCVITFLDCWLEKKVFFTPDDMTMWALSFKVLKTENELYSFVDIGQPHFSYPPALQLIWYYFSFGQKDIHEWEIFAINNCSWYIFLATVFSQIDQLEMNAKRIRKCFGVGIITVLSVSCFCDLLPYTACLFVEPTMLVIFGAMLIIYFTDMHRPQKENLLLGILGIVLALTKDNGLILLACYCALVMVSRIISLIMERENLKKFLGDMIGISMTGICGLGFWLLWNLTGKFSSHGNALQRTVEITEVNNELLDGNIIKTIFSNFFSALNSENIAWATSLTVLCVICVIIFFAFKYVERYKAEKIIWGIAVGFLLQISALLFLYIHVFSQTEALTHAQMGRYLSPYLGGCLILAIAVVGTEWVEFQKREKGKGFLVIQLWTVLCLLIIKSINLVNTPFYIEYKAELEYDVVRTIVHNNADEIKEKLDPDDIIYVIAQGDYRNGKTATIPIAALYEYYPYYVVPNCDTSFSLPIDGWEDIKKNATRYQSEYFTTYMQPEELMWYLYERGVTKILVVPSSQEMEPEYQALFEDGLEGILSADSARLYDVNGYETLPFKRLY